MEIREEYFGKTKDGETINKYILTNKNGMEAAVINYGAVLLKLIVPDSKGVKEDVVLGYDTLEGYFDNGACLGITVGRNCNRIAKAEFEMDGVVYKLKANEGENNLHTDADNGMQKKCFEAKPDESNNSVSFFIEEEDGANGFPGALSMIVTYTLSDEDELFISYSGVSDKKTVINCTNHSYFNLDGHDKGSIIDHKISINADSIVAIRDGAIPTGELMPVENTPFDLREAKRIGDGIDAEHEQIKVGGGYDHCFAINGADHTMKLVATVYASESDRCMEVYTDLPGIQFYAGNFLPHVEGKDGAVYDKRYGLALETSYFPDSVNHENFEKPIFDAGCEYKTTTCYKFRRA